MSTFKAGDRVRCINARTSDLVEGAVYTVNRISYDRYLSLTDSTGEVTAGWGVHRFEPANDRSPFKPGDRVRCIDANQGSFRRLELGKTYTIADSTHPDRVRLREHGPRLFYPRRFELIEEPSVTVTTTINTPDAKAFAKSLGCITSAPHADTARITIKQPAPPTAADLLQAAHDLIEQVRRQTNNIHTITCCMVAQREIATAGMHENKGY
jgi:hypothetical protein